MPQADTATMPPPADAVGALGVYQLKRLWAGTMASRSGRPFPHDRDDFHLNRLVLHALGLGLEQTSQYLGRTAPTFDAFERWTVKTAGEPEPSQVARINAAIAGDPCPDETARWLAAVEADAPVLSADDLAFWEQHGYVVLRDAVPTEGREAATEAVFAHLGARAEDAESWYRRRDHGIMVQYFQHAAFAANRRSPRIHKAFAQLWGTADLWVTTDRVGFNVPERAGWLFPGPDLHWDVSLQQPIPFGTQGILYLTDTPAEQGAFTCVPGFQRRVAEWLADLPPGAAPRQQNLHALGSRPIAGRAGDLVIWHHALPHGSRPNRGTRPRVVQYIDMYPARAEVRETWL